MISVTAAMQQIAACRTSWGTENIPLEQSVGRVLAEPVAAGRDYPPFHRAARDGFAIRFAEYHSARRKQFPVINIFRSESELPPDHVAKVATGAILPPDIDTVMAPEDMEAKNGNLRIYQNILRKGEDATAGHKVLEAGTRIHFQHLALLASMGVASVKVHRPPRVVIISAGTELRLLGAPVAQNQLHDANSYTVSGLLAQYGIIPESRFIVPEDKPALEQVIAASLEADLLVISGEATNVITEVLQECGVEQVFHKVRAKPCKPLWFGYSPTKTRVIAFSGHPFAVQVGSKLFLETYIRACWNLQHIKPWFLPYTDHRTAVTSLDEYVPAMLLNKNGLRVRGTHTGNIVSAAQADGFICHSTDTGSLEPGSLVPFYPWVDTQSAT
jgi:molybdopterin molybdotransferase